MMFVDSSGAQGQELAAVLADAVPVDCAIARSGLVPTYADQGSATARVVVGPQHLNQVGVVQGGVYALIADATAGFAAMSLLGDDKTFVTLEMRVNLLRGAKKGDVLIAEASPVHRGNTTSVFDVRVYAEGDTTRRPYAFFTCTQLVMDLP